MQRGARPGQLPAQAFLAFRDRHRGHRFAIEVGKIEQEKDESVAVSGVRCVLD
jgi:hypothetical protein